MAADRVANQDRARCDPQKVHPSVVEGEVSAAVGPGDFADDASGLHFEAQVCRSFLEIERDFIVTDRVGRVEGLIRVFVDAGSVVIERRREGVARAA